MTSTSNAPHEGHSGSSSYDDDWSTTARGLRVLDNVHRDRPPVRLRWYPVAFPVTDLARYAEAGRAERQTRITKLIATEPGQDNASGVTPAFTSPLHRAFRTCEPRRLRRSYGALRV